MEATIISEQHGPVLLIRINRPDKKNALTRAMYCELTDALTRLQQSPELRVGLIAGCQGSLTAGNDLKDFLDGNGVAGDTPVNRFLQTLSQCEKPLVAAVEGLAIGIGTTLLLHVDLAYASADAHFAMPFVKLGLCPEAGSSKLLTELVGIRKATELLLLGERFGAEEALAYGLINAITEGPSEVIAMEKAQALAALPPQALAASRALLRTRGQREVAQTIQAEIEQFDRLLTGEESRQAISAFFEGSRRK